MSIDVLICSLNKGIVRVDEVMLPPRSDVHYIVSYQYTDERYLDLIPESLSQREDVTLYKYNGQGLSANRNLAMEKSTAELFIYADDDTHFTEETFDIIFETFKQETELDIAFFRASTYTGKLLKSYPENEQMLTAIPIDYIISAIEMVCRREAVQGKIRFDERFGLGAKFLTCGEEEIWMEDAVKAGFKMKYFPFKIVETSTLLKKSMIYVDAGVQRSYGAILYYKYGRKAWLKSLQFAWCSVRKRMCHFNPFFRHLLEGIAYMRKTE